MVLTWSVNMCFLNKLICALIHKKTKTLRIELVCRMVRWLISREKEGRFTLYNDFVIVFQPVRVTAYYWKETNPGSYAAANKFPPLMVHFEKYHLYSTPSLEYPGLIKVKIELTQIFWLIRLVLIVAKQCAVQYLVAWSTLVRNLVFFSQCPKVF